jgi:hypothetical protein
MIKFYQNGAELLCSIWKITSLTFLYIESASETFIANVETLGMSFLRVRSLGYVKLSSILKLTLAKQGTKSEWYWDLEISSTEIDNNAWIKHVFLISNIFLPT